MHLLYEFRTLYAEERIIIIGERTTNNSIICSMGGGGCRDFLDSLNQGVDISSDFLKENMRMKRKLRKSVQLEWKVMSRLVKELW